jgi:hypothetical protein
LTASIPPDASQALLQRLSDALTVAGNKNQPQMCQICRAVDGFAGAFSTGGKGPPLNHSLTKFVDS